MLSRKYGRWALVIGGSEGIGRELVLKLADAGVHVALTARKQAPSTTRRSSSTRVMDRSANTDPYRASND